ncbi:probable WRKY transcription factor 70 isoform X1 [Vigna radiata var. radiata]|uniref:Probable WRKY transcription factor 70 isoform X1 n=1 Tax=Vigna radiata var. radiata TaxID=3916 RepID=A0A1S3VU71_VIGRR|nr:probable WRKY transcription factor 70 isoform X1 [Vigna radiata var. radiata]
MNNMVCAETESVSAGKKREMMEEIIKGKKAAIELKILLQKPSGSEPFLSYHQLMASVLTSFTQSLSIISSSSSEPSSPDGLPHRNLLNPTEYSSPVTASGNDPTSGHCSEKRSQKGGRGRYNRCKGATRKIILSCTTDDKYAWRKYGQKGILNYEFPRSYFRCSHKHDQGCKATKQVQLEQDNPRMYRITYIGLHTCNDIPMVTHKTTDFSTGESYLLHSDRSSNVKDDLISSPNLAIKPVFPKETYTSSDLTDHKLLDSSMWLEYWKESEPFNSTIMPLRKEFDNSADNAYSCADIQNLDMDFGGVASVLFDTHFHFDEDQFF